MLKPLHAILRTPLRRAIAGVFIAAVLTGALAIKKSGALSPGRLSARHPQDRPLKGYVSHADFESECTHCHAPLHCLTDDRCQSCHQDIARQRATAQGLHSLLPGTENCQSCHSEHGGPEAVITRVSFANLNHEKLAGFSLVHHQKDYDESRLDCSACHPGDSYGRESLDCLSCHSDADHDGLAAHIERYGPGCTGCHDGVDRMEDFEHNRVFALEGGHAESGCEACHAEYTFAGTPQDCAGCHAEPELHAGLFGQDCVLCHTAAAWAPAQMARHEFVSGLMAEDVPGCEVCHAGSYSGYPCYGCHTQDEMVSAHPRQLANLTAAGEAALSDCVACHPAGRAGGVAAGMDGGAEAGPGDGESGDDRGARSGAPQPGASWMGNPQPGVPQLTPTQPGTPQAGPALPAGR